MSKFIELTLKSDSKKKFLFNIDNIILFYTSSEGTVISLRDDKKYVIIEEYDEIRNLLEVL